MAHRHNSRSEVGVVGPCAIELRAIARGVQVEETDFFRVERVVHVEHAQTSAVVALVGNAILDVQVVVDGRRVGHKGPGQKRVVEVFHIEEIGGGVHPALLFVQFVAHHEVLVVFRQPPLVGVGHSAVTLRGDQRRIGGVGHVDNGDVVLVASKGNFPVLVLGILSNVVDHLGIVGVAVLGKGPQDGRIQRVLDVHNVQTSGGGVGAHTVGAATLLVDDDVVGVAKS